MNEALLRFNAAACENAKRDICRCRCGGALHRMLHSEAWISSELERLVLEAKGRRAPDDLQQMVLL